MVIAEGIALKAPKLKKMVDKLGIDGWDWLDKLINKEFEEEEKKEDVVKFTDANYKPKIEEEEENEEEAEEEELEPIEKEESQEDIKELVKPKDKYLSDIVAGRPVFCHPSRKGGFRLRYGRARNSGFATVGINPATMVIVDNFIAIGTQLKVERPGKAGGVVPVTTIDGPTVKLKNGDVVKVNDYQTALAVKDEVEEIIDLGEILVNFGDFLENNHPLMPASFCYEWWIQYVRQKGLSGDYRKISEDEALKLCDEYNVPLHPDYTYLWHDISVDDYFYLRDYIAENGKIDGKMLVLRYDEKAKRILEDLLVEHKVREGNIVLEKWKVLVRCLGLTFDLKKVNISPSDDNDVLKIVRRLSGLDVRAKAPTRIGARMGRPEKSKERRMSPPPHILFPVGLAGGKQRNIKEAIDYTENYNSAKGEITVEIALRRCKECGKETFWLKCDCGGLTEQMYYCPRCRIKVGTEICPNCRGEANAYMKKKINIREIYEKALKNLSEWDNLEAVKGVIGMTSKWKLPERLEKGILRAKHGVFVFKDGTIRYDMTDLPLTHFKPKEIGVSVEKLRELGYKYDYLGNELKSDDQIVELKPQDIVISKNCAEYLVKVAKFIDDLLVKFYGLEPFYKVEKPEDLIGHLVIGLAPHTSAGVLGRIIGFVDMLACYAHPYFHAAKRRNCFTPDTEILVNLNGEVKRMRLDQLYELFDDEVYESGVWVRRKPKTNVKVYSFDFDSKRVVLTDIEYVMKTHSPNHLIRIKLEGGKTFEVTPDHKVIVFENGSFVKKRALEVKEGDVMLSPFIEFENDDVSEMDLLEEFAKCDDLHNTVVVRNIKDFLLKILDDRERKHYRDRIRLDSIPIGELLEILRKKSMSLDDVPKDAYVAVKRDKVRVKRFIKVEPLLKLLGYYLAEGYARCNGSCYQVVFSSYEEDVKEDIRNAIREAFGDLKLYERGGKITICSKIVYLLFTRILKAGSNAKDKRVPSFVFKLPKNKVRILLSAYASGDGTAIRTKPRVSLYSANLQLLRDIELLLSSKFGIKSYITADKNANRDNSIVVRYYKSRDCSPPKSEVYALNITSEYYDKFFEEIGFTLIRKLNVYELHKYGKRLKDKNRTDYGWLLKVKEVEYVKSNNEFVYCLSAKDYHNVIVNDNVVTAQCDGDEDSVMLLLDGLLNFSRYFLPDKRGGQMDAPLVLTAIVDPREVDKEVHNMDIVDHYPVEFYEATLRYADPKDVASIIERVEDRLSSDYRFCCLSFTHDTNIALGVRESAYKSLKSMQDKVRAQMSLAEKIRAVDEHDVAERVLTCHFLPDIIGNLRAFSRQEFRCVNCNTKYKRPPLNGKCTKCGGKLTLTVHNSSITKYLGVSKELCEKYNVSNYTKQRLMLIDLEIKSLFESDTRRQIKISDFFG